MKLYIQKSYQFTLYLLVFILPWQRVASSIPIILLAITTLLLFLSNQVDLSRFLKTIKTKYPIFIFLISYFIITLFGLLYTDETYMPQKAIQLSILCLILPISLAVSHEKNVNFHMLCRVFVVSNFSFFIISICSSFFLNYEELGVRAFFYETLYAIFKVNPISISFHYNLAIALVLFIPQLFLKKKYSWAIVGLLQIALFFTASRIGIILGVVQLFIFCIFYFKQKHKIVKPFILLLLTLGVVFTFVSKSDFLQSRLFKTKDIFQTSDLPPDERNHRIVTYEQAIGLIKEKPFLGYGTGATKFELKQKFIAIGFKMAEWRHYNAHNQILESGIEFGVVGILFWIVFFIYLLYISIKFKNTFSFIFFCLFLAYCLIETPFKNQSMFVLSIIGIYLVSRHLALTQTMQE